MMRPDPRSATSLDLDLEHVARIAPARALLTPTWIASLVLLVVNDHALKGSGLLPGVVTGKLSDLAGMVVAPVLLAALLRVRTRGGLLACFAAVGAVFSAIQLSPAFAASWSAAMGLLGFPWTITCDPTDLLALPMLAVAWRVLVPEMDGAASFRAPARRSAAGLASLVGLWASVATSYDDGGDVGPGPGFEGPLQANFLVNNASEAPLPLTVRELRAELDIDCSVVALDPARMLVSEAFTEGQEHMLEPRENLGLRIDADADCDALWVEGVGVDPQIIFVAEPSEWPVESWPLDALEVPVSEQIMTVSPTASGGTWAGGEPLRYTPEALPDPAAWGCERPAGEQRIDWSPPSHADNEVLSLAEADEQGCRAISLRPVGTELEPVDWTLCTPDAALPFAIGEYVELLASAGADGHEQLEVTVLDPETLEPALNEHNRIVRRTHFLRGGPHLGYLSSVIEQELAAEPVLNCPWQAVPGCASVERPVDLAFVELDAQFIPGQAMDVELGNFTGTAVLGHARERAVVDPSCVDGGARQLRLDLDFAFMIEG